MNHGPSIPVLGFGTYSGPPKDRVIPALKIAIEAGYRLIDTAIIYQNEHFIGKALKEIDIPREELFITTKIWKDAMRFNAARDSLEESLENLGVEYVDLALIHRPLSEFNLETWHTLEDLHNEGLAKSIGVSNFIIKHLDPLLEDCKIVPAINQIEIHPFFYRRGLVEYCQKHDIIVEAYSPLALAKKMDDERLVSMAKKHGKTPSQVMLRWSLQHDILPIPRSQSKDHILENINVFDFELTKEDMEEMDGWTEDFMAIAPDPDEPDLR
ncbi:MAG: aldo/keto reductase [Candidatus Hodarchaeota archaeon]